MYKYIKASKDDQPFYLGRQAPKGTNRHLYEEFTWPNNSTYIQDNDIVAAIAYMYGESYSTAKQELQAGDYTHRQVQNALDYYAMNASDDWDKDE